MARIGSTALTNDDRAQAGFDRRPYFHSPVDPASPTSSYGFQSGWQNSTSSPTRRTSFSANAIPLHAPPQSVGTASATPFARAYSSSYYSTQSPSRSTTLCAFSLVPTRPVAPTPATNFAPAASSFQLQRRSSTPRSTFAPKIPSPLAAPQFVTTNPTTTLLLAPLPDTERLTPLVDRHAQPTPLRHSHHLNRSILLPQLGPPLPSLLSNARSHAMTYHLPNNLCIAGLEETAAYLDRRYHDSMRGVNLMVKDYVFPYTLTVADDAKKAKQKIEKVTNQIATVDREWSKFHALWYEECEKFDQAEEALKKAQWILEKTDEEVAGHQAYLHELQTGQAANKVSEQRAIGPLQPESQPSRPVAEQAEEGGTSPAAATWSQKMKKVAKSWDSQWKSMIALHRYSVPRAVQTPVKSDEANRRPERNQGQGADSATLDPSQWIKSGPGLIGLPKHPSRTCPDVKRV